jgi:hypothetical protein
MMRNILKRIGIFVVFLTMLTVYSYSQDLNNSPAVIFHGDFADPSLLRVRY